MKIGELAQQAQCTVETIRYYERSGLLPPPARGSGNYRRYQPAHLQQLRFIRNCRALDMSHEEIRALLTLQADPAARCAPVHAVLAQHLTHIDARIAELQVLKSQLQTLQQHCHSPAGARCDILNELGQQNPPEVGRGTHL